MPTALAAADVVVVPALEAPVLGRAVAEAQAMGRPVIASQLGMLPEHLLAPPRMPEGLRTGWTVKAGDAAELAQAIAAALTLDAAALPGDGDARATVCGADVFARERGGGDARRLRCAAGPGALRAFGPALAATRQQAKR